MEYEMSGKRMQAARLGEKKFKGNPCKVCGGTERYTASGGCVACASKHSKVYRERIQETMKQSNGAA
jgi:hypothetical protein